LGQGSLALRFNDVCLSQRLIGAVAQNPRMLWIGIDEDTAIIVQDEADSQTALSIFGLHVPGSGAKFDLRSRSPC
jgi:hypothetical protein